MLKLSLFFALLNVFPLNNADDLKDIVISQFLSSSLPLPKYRQPAPTKKNFGEMWGGEGSVFRTSELTQVPECGDSGPNEFGECGGICLDPSATCEPFEGFDCRCVNSKGKPFKKGEVAQVTYQATSFMY